MKKYKTPILIVLGVGLLFFLMYLPTLNNPNKDLIKEWNSIGADCLNSHQDVSAHYHPNVSIIVDGEEERIPADIGIVSTCMAEIHTHDSSGQIHVEPLIPSKEFTIGQFFAVWDKDLDREGYELNATVNGEILENPGSLIFADGQQIRLEYSSISTSTESS